MPSAANPIPQSAVPPEISPIDADAAIATMTAPRHATRSAIECSGGPGRLAVRIVSMILIAIERAWWSLPGWVRGTPRGPNAGRRPADPPRAP